jgi:hypothetical protein
MMAATRRLAAILAAYVAEYSRLMGADEEGIIPPVRTHVVARWTGQGHDRQRTPDYHVRPEADSVLDSASATRCARCGAGAWIRSPSGANAFRESRRGR